MDKMPQAIVSPSTTPRTRGAAIEQFQKTTTVNSPKNTRKTIETTEEIDENTRTPKSAGRPKKVQTPSQSSVSSPNIMTNRTSSRNSQLAPSTPSTPKTNENLIQFSPRVSRSNLGTPKTSNQENLTVNSPRVSYRKSMPTTPIATRKSIIQESPTTSLRRSRSAASAQNTPKRGKNNEEPEVETLKTPIRKKQIENEKTPKTAGRKSPETPKSNLRRSRSSTSTENSPKKGKNSETEMETVKTPQVPIRGNDNLRNSLRNKEAAAKTTPKRVEAPAVVSSPKENVRPSRSTTKTVAAAIISTRSSRSTSDKRNSLSSGPTTPVRTTRRNLRPMQSAKK